MINSLIFILFAFFSGSMNYLRGIRIDVEVGDEDVHDGDDQARHGHGEGVEKLVADLEIHN